LDAVALVLVLVGVFVVTQWGQIIKDQFLAWGFRPSAEVERLAERVGFTTAGKRIAWASQPELESGGVFNQNCSTAHIEANVLGCYDSYKIHLFDVKNAELNGIKEVTLAHETLHAVFERLSQSKRYDLCERINSVYSEIKTSQLESRLQNYSSSDRCNELHSILGTEYPAKSSELEDHYDDYFKDRQMVLALYESYDQKFSELKAEADKIEAQLVAINKRVSSNSGDYKAGVEDLNQRISRFNARADGGEFTNEEQFNAERAALLDRSSELEALRVKVNADIDKYNQLIKQYNALQVRAQKLDDSINSKLQDVPKL
jgi:hypothetical protein